MQVDDDGEPMEVEPSEPSEPSAMDYSYCASTEVDDDFMQVDDDGEPMEVEPSEPSEMDYSY
ncbi:MAG: hypothetical protein ACRDL7_03490, partial [Gaiellaceae bacterium]